MTAREGPGYAAPALTQNAAAKQRLNGSLAEDRRRQGWTTRYIDSRTRVLGDPDALASVNDHVRILYDIVGELVARIADLEAVER